MFLIPAFRMRAALVVAAIGFVGLSGAAHAQDGPLLFKTHCATCHDPATSGAPPIDVLRRMGPEQILRSLESGAMQRQAAERSRAQRRVLAEYLSGRRLADEPAAMPASALCRPASAPAVAASGTQGPGWNGWGNGIFNRRFQSAEAAGMTPDDVPRLKLVWAFGLRGASSAGTQPVVVGGRLYIATAEGEVYALDAKTRCVHWTLEVEAGVRTAITIERQAGDRLVAYFGDQSANVYAVDATAGRLLWKVQVDDHPRAAITGAPQLYNDRLYVPVASREESQVGDPKYPCCEFRGSLVAVDRNTGRMVWKTFTIPDPAKPTVKNSIGTQLFGPSGAPMWNAPTIDVKRNLLYVGTGNNYSPPATDASDAIVAFDLATGKIRWINQIFKEDIWNASCRRTDREPAVCPDKDAPDYDFPGSPILVDLAGGRQLIVVGNKSGSVYAFDPDHGGRIVWEQIVARGATGGGVFWGAAVDDANVYAADAFFDTDKPETSGGLSALELGTGRVLWKVPGAGCVQKSPCKPSQVAALTVIPGVVFSGTMDGRLRAYSTADGRLLWETDTARAFGTVNGVTANGGSMSNGGPAVVDGMLYVNSGYSHHGGILPGNVLLAFSAR
jgi:polyvinyl alcohol dehydrogenase (cytochrome)